MSNWFPIKSATKSSEWSNGHDAFVGVRLAANCLAYANSCLNPILYAFLSDNFRSGLVRLCHRRGDVAAQHRGTTLAEARRRRETVSAGQRDAGRGQGTRDDGVARPLLTAAEGRRYSLREVQGTGEDSGTAESDFGHFRSVVAAVSRERSVTVPCRAVPCSRCTVYWTDHGRLVDDAAGQRGRRSDAAGQRHGGRVEDGVVTLLLTAAEGRGCSLKDVQGVREEAAGVSTALQVPATLQTETTTVTVETAL